MKVLKLMDSDKDTRFISQEDVFYIIEIVDEFLEPYEYQEAERFDVYLKKCDEVISCFSIDWVELESVPPGTRKAKSIY